MKRSVPGWAEGKFSAPGARDLLAPVIHLEPLTPEEMLVLCEKTFRYAWGSLRLSKEAWVQNDLADFIKLEYGRIGADQKHYAPAR